MTSKNDCKIQWILLPLFNSTKVLCYRQKKMVESQKFNLPVNIGVKQRIISRNSSPCNDADCHWLMTRYWMCCKYSDVIINQSTVRRKQTRFKSQCQWQTVWSTKFWYLNTQSFCRFEKFYNDISFSSKSDTNVAVTFFASTSHRMTYRKSLESTEHWNPISHAPNVIWFDATVRSFLCNERACCAKRGGLYIPKWLSYVFRTCITQNWPWC